MVRLGRAPIIIITFFLLVLILAYQQGHIPQPSILRPLTPLTCHDEVRLKVNATLPQEVKLDIWTHLEEIFREARPIPDTLERPPRPKDGSDPVIPEMREQVVISKSDAQRTRELHTALLEKLPSSPGTFKGRGLVILAGTRYSEFAATSLGVLRELGSKIPVEVWFMNAGEGTEGWCDDLAAEGMACRLLTDYMDTGALSHPYQYKAFTMLFSSFEELVLTDADSIALRDPLELFDADVYQKNGVVLWPDYWESVASPHLPFITGVTSEWQDHRWYTVGTVESGQVYWHKGRHWKSLVLAAYYNYYGPQYWWTLLSANFAGWGDKETFPLALRVLGEPWHQIEHPTVKVIQHANEQHSGQSSVAMLQGAPTNDTYLFLHCNIIKFSVRALFCDGCRDIYSPDRSRWKSIYEMPDDVIYENLHNGLRILDQTPLSAVGLDPEPLLFKAMEFTACRSHARRNEQVCGSIRRHMRKAFGFHFHDLSLTANKSLDATALLTSPDLCIEHPPGWHYFN